ncbi:MAG: carbonic anhydrase [Oscillospiraceae bacterium]|nr:carbonic anhydrase [Oscillospiraceae bacterium]
MVEIKVRPEEAMELLIKGNEKYVNALQGIGDVSPQARERTLTGGQHPYAIIISCADSRVIPEAIFSAGIGDLFVIRVAGNVIDNHQLGSIEYAAGHLGAGLVVVLGHNHCGAVDAAMNHNPEGYIKFITDEIVKAVGDEKNEYRACCLNALNSKALIESSLEIREDEKQGLKVIAAIYHLETGAVDFLENY